MELPWPRLVVVSFHLLVFCPKYEKMGLHSCSRAIDIMKKYLSIWQAGLRHGKGSHCVRQKIRGFLFAYNERIQMKYTDLEE